MEEMVMFSDLSDNAKVNACKLALEGKEPKAHKRRGWSVKPATEATVHYKPVDFGDVDPAEYLESIKAPA